MNESAFEPRSGFYSVDLPGVAHIVSLNSYLPWGEGSTQHTWLLQDLGKGRCLRARGAFSFGYLQLGALLPLPPPPHTAGKPSPGPHPSYPPTHPRLCSQPQRDALAYSYLAHGCVPQL